MIQLFSHIPLKVLWSFSFQISHFFVKKSLRSGFCFQTYKNFDLPRHFQKEKFSFLATDGVRIIQNLLEIYCRLQI